MILVFDLDDTLYEEESFVISGFQSVSRYLSTLKSLDQAIEFKKMYKIFKEKGRGNTFNYYLKSNGIFSVKLLKRIVAVYRTHIPSITMLDEDRKTIETLSNEYAMYLVTDGNKNVQSNKIKALDIEKYFKKIFITHRYGLHASKPSIYCFQKIIELEKVSWNDIIYIGDDPSKDFINLRKAGCNTIRVLQGRFNRIKLSHEYEADFEIEKLTELPEMLEKIESST